MGIDIHFSSREKVLFGILGILLIVAAYVFLIHLPVEENLERISAETEAAKDEILILEAKQNRMESIKEELEQVQNQMNPISIPDFDNQQNVMRFLDQVLTQYAVDYTIHFEEPLETEESSLILRKVALQAQTSSYVQAKKMTTALESCPYRCNLEQLELLPTKDTGDRGSINDTSVVFSAELVFFEMQ